MDKSYRRKRMFRPERNIRASGKPNHTAPKDGFRGSGARNRTSIPFALPCTVQTLRSVPSQSSWREWCEMGNCESGVLAQSVCLSALLRWCAPLLNQHGTTLQCINDNRKFLLTLPGSLSRSLFAPLIRRSAIDDRVLSICMRGVRYRVGFRSVDDLDLAVQTEQLEGVVRDG